MANQQDDPSALIVPFGKHQGLTVAELLERDPNYVNWLLSQNWLAQRFAQLHAAIVTRGATPDDTPEHNQIQARFLDPSFRAGVISLIHDLKDAQDRDCRDRAAEPTRQKDACLEQIDRCNKLIEGYGEEDHWGFRQKRIEAREERQKDLAKFQARLDAIKPRPLISAAEFECEGIDVVISWGFEYRESKIHVEIKPSLGDDYPAVMRQMSRLGARVLVIDQYNSDTLTINTVREMFKANRQILITLQEIFDQIPDAKNFMGNSA